MFGFWNVNKPIGMTSRDVVSKFQRWVKPNKVGHAGTLDPLASGVLLVAVGQATRLISYAQQLSKTYVAEFLLGQSSAGDDLEAEVTLHPNLAIPSRDELESLLPQFCGEIMQRPPARSAIKVAGKRAYELSRKGIDVDLPARPVVVHRLNILTYEFPKLELEIECGSGTYVRSIGRDLAEAAGTRGLMSKLERTSIGGFGVREGLDLDQIQKSDLESSLCSPTTVLADLPKVVVDDGDVIELGHGRMIHTEFDRSNEEVVLLDARGRLVALARPTEQGNSLKPTRVFKSS